MFSLPRFLSLVPEDIRSTSMEDFESYKQDALKQYRDVCRVRILYSLN